MKLMLWTAGYDGRIKYWDVATGNCIYTLNYTDCPINVLKATKGPNEKLVTGGYGQMVIYEMTKTDQIKEVGKIQGHKASITDVAFYGNDGYMMTTSEDKTIRCWNMKTEKEIYQITLKEAGNVIVIHPNRTQCFIGMESNGIQVRDLRKLEELQLQLKIENVIRPVVQTMDMTSDGKFVVVGTRGGQVVLFELNYEDEKQTGMVTSYQQKQLLENAAQAKYILKVTVAPNAKMVAVTSSERLVYIYQFETHQEKGVQLKLHSTLQGHKNWVWSCQFTPDSLYLVTCGSDGTARLWDIQNGETIQMYKGHQKRIFSLQLQTKQ